MNSEAAVVPHSLAEHIHTGGTLDSFRREDLEQLAAIVADLGDSSQMCENPDADDLIAALALPDPSRTARRQWERELEASNDLREVVRSMLPPVVMALADEMAFRLTRSQARP